MLSISRRRGWQLIALGCLALLSASTFYLEAVGEYFGSGDSLKSDSIDLVFRYCYDCEIKAIISAKPFPAEIDSEEIEVYKALYDTVKWEAKPLIQNSTALVHSNASNLAAKIVIQDETYWQPEIKWDSMLHMIRRYGSPWMIYDFHRKNALWPRKHNLQRYSSEVYSISKDEMSRIFHGRRSWDNYHEEFPASGCLHGISRVGFSWNRKTAILHASWLCGPLWGEGNLIILTKREGKWVVAKKIRTWIS